jgi:hypothetical protein
MAIFYGQGNYGCGKYEARGWDPACPETEVWVDNDEPIAGTDHDHEEVDPIEV